MKTSGWQVTSAISKCLRGEKNRLIMSASFSSLEARCYWGEQIGKRHGTGRHDTAYRGMAYVVVGAYLGSGRLIFLLALAAGVHLLVSMAIR